MNHLLSRREFLRRSAAAFACAPAFLRANALPPSERLNLGVIGVANRAAANLKGVAHHNVVALCDVDATFLAGAREQFPRAAAYADFRRLLDRKDLDAVVVSTPDHTHAVAAVAALQSGRHVYCEKPLARTISEVRRMREAAAQSGLVTQTGIQIHSEPNYRRVVELIRAGAIGPVTDVHHWTGSNELWHNPAMVPTEQPVPEGLAWDLWLGPTERRPYSPAYAPRSWRRFWDFGGGALADMAAHHMDLSFWALELDAPQTVQAEGPPPDTEEAPEWLRVNYDFPARGSRPAVRMHWHHGGKLPEPMEAGEIPVWNQGTLFVGSEGMLLANYNRYLLLPEASFAGFVPPEPSIPDSVGHHEEWLRACKGEGRTSCDFGYGARLSEAALLGNVAFRAGEKIEWDAARGRIVGNRRADQLLRHRYRRGWRI